MRYVELCLFLESKVFEFVESLARRICALKGEEEGSINEHELYMQKVEAQCREHIKKAQQLRYFNEELKQKLREKDSREFDLQIKYKSQLEGAQKENQRLAEENLELSTNHKNMSEQLKECEDKLKEAESTLSKLKWKAADTEKEQNRKRAEFYRMQAAYRVEEKKQSQGEMQRWLQEIAKNTENEETIKRLKLEVQAIKSQSDTVRETRVPQLLERLENREKVIERLQMDLGKFQFQLKEKARETAALRQENDTMFKELQKYKEKAFNDYKKTVKVESNPSLVEVYKQKVNEKSSEVQELKQKLRKLLRRERQTLVKELGFEAERSAYEERISILKKLLDDEFFRTGDVANALHASSRGFASPLARVGSQGQLRSDSQGAFGRSHLMNESRTAFDANDEEIARMPGSLPVSTKSSTQRMLPGLSFGNRMGAHGSMEDITITTAETPGGSELRKTAKHFKAVKRFA
eukprot:CAMPEP_0114974636 /NCGR_PEP_ID=MMETSP0216-20121206/1635_1 /TAXON_ID=223996 /ORGANISM="Protocruzia adherens, Strain Boccale" /LENGTH=465 /DNA_ID=CAMNT_0002335291 /DNA_START=111 /DNA_END=1508 /DNA_ORIENTATION=+